MFFETRQNISSKCHSGTVYADSAGSASAVVTHKALFNVYVTPGLKIHQRGVQWKQGAVISMMLYTSLLHNITPIHCTPLPLHPSLMNTQGPHSRETIHVCVCIYIYICIILPVYIYMYIYIYVCTHIYIYIYIYMHATRRTASAGSWRP